MPDHSDPSIPFPTDARGVRTRGRGSARASSACTLALALTGAMLPVVAGAAELYRWVEADGSITFSPTRPAAGIEFEVVGASTPTPDERDAFAAAMSGEAAGDAASAAPPAPAATGSRQGGGVSYAPAPPGLGAAVATDASEGIRASGEAAVVTRPAPGSPTSGSPAGAGTQDPAADDRDAVTVDVDPAAARRRSQCRELEKRVVSLERSLMQEMLPARMDDTVMAMARYQSSFDAHCRR